MPGTPIHLALLSRAYILTDQSVTHASATMAARPRRARSARQAKAGRRRRRNGEGAPDRREAILAAALDKFSLRGFEGARLDDVAQRAGVAKGTIYLYFRDKEALFQELVRSVIGPLIARYEASAEIDLPARLVAERIVEMFVTEIYGTRRKDVIRLIIADPDMQRSANSGMVELRLLGYAVQDFDCYFRAWRASMCRFRSSGTRALYQVTCTLRVSGRPDLACFQT